MYGIPGSNCSLSWELELFREVGGIKSGEGFTGGKNYMSKFAKSNELIIHGRIWRDIPTYMRKE